MLLILKQPKELFHQSFSFWPFVKKYVNKRKKKQKKNTSSVDPQRNCRDIF